MKSHTYNLASTIEAYHSTHTKENDCKPFNMFKTKDLDFAVSKSLHASTKSYDVVGFKELRNFETKSRKERKMHTRKATGGKETRPTSRESKKNNDLLSK
jgi:hypothetical protein